jgi:hypothetical protein
LPPLSNTDQLFSSSAKDRSTVCQSLVTSIIRLNPSSFLGFLFSFQNSVFFVFHRWSAGSFAAESLGNLNMNGSNVWCMVRLYILCSDYDCIPFFLILSSDTQEKVCYCVL